MKNQTIPQERIMNKIIFLRNEKVLLDIHLSELYNVETRVLKQAVKRNIDLFPNDFLFILTEEEVDLMVSQIVIPSKQSLGGARPFAFTETGVAMLSSVLKSKNAKEMNIAIMRTFVALRKLASNHIEILEILKKIDRKMIIHDDQLKVIFNYLNKLETTKKEEFKYQNRTKIGFKKE